MATEHWAHRAMPALYAGHMVLTCGALLSTKTCDDDDVARNQTWTTAMLLLLLGSTAVRQMWTDFASARDVALVSHRISTFLMMLCWLFLPPLSILACVPGRLAVDVASVGGLVLVGLGFAGAVIGAVIEYRRPTELPLQPVHSTVV